MKRKQHPYCVYSAPIEVHYAARVMGSDRDPHVSFETLFKHFGLLENGLVQLCSLTLYKGYKAKLAARETAHQRLVVTAWEIEESEHFTAFLDALHDENKEQVGFADRELQNLRSRLPSLEIHNSDDNQIILDDSSDSDSDEEECLGASVGDEALPIVNVMRIFICTLHPYCTLSHPSPASACLRNEPESNTYASPSSAQAGYAPFAPAHDVINTYAGPSNTHTGPSSVQAGYAPFAPAHDIINTYAGPSNTYAGPSSAHADYAPFAPAHDIIDTYAGPSNTYAGPSSVHTDYAPFAPAYDVIDTYAGPSNAYEDYGEISHSHVIHTAGPARSSNMRQHTRKLPATLYIAHETVVSETMQAAAGLAEALDNNRHLQITGPMCEQIFKRSKELVIGIATPKIPGLHGTPHWDNQKKDLSKIWRTVLVMRMVLTTLTREGIVLAYEFLPPQGSSISPEAFCIERDGMLTIHSKFKNPFILHLVMRLVWNMCFRLDTLLISPHRELHYVMGAAGTFTKHILLEQGHMILTVSKVSLDSNNSTFQMLCSDMDGLTDEEKVELDGWKDHMVICGISQQHVGNELSDFNLSPADLDHDLDTDV
ncbi:uncharacterized protein F5891DRAFT_980444 [Suillus fuscotomentosus]|uniref:Uncharacterized protein n=1 Tax=Suillus fuscotomentosus TaxID=1912939 RepID=A0AAD4E6A6_9AGAM|nr:uncharacterized protein F5891DRAFT_980444 [Suillus fuscotomentosus]KAG1900152.1 hypothetical protein F5891DRAFT_980444 [Suillus fuscotomentosus]